MKILAPNGKILADRIQKDDNYEIVIIFIGEKALNFSSNLQSHLPHTLYLPTKTSPFNFVWPLAGCDVYLVDTDQSTNSFIEFCAKCFFSYGANLIHYVSSLRSFIIEKGVSHD